MGQWAVSQWCWMEQDTRTHRELGSYSQSSPQRTSKTPLLHHQRPSRYVSAKGRKTHWLDVRQNMPKRTERSRRWGEWSPSQRSRSSTKSDRQGCITNHEFNMDALTVASYVPCCELGKIRWTSVMHEKWLIDSMRTSHPNNPWTRTWITFFCISLDGAQNRRGKHTTEGASVSPSAASSANKPCMNPTPKSDNSWMEGLGFSKLFRWNVLQRKRYPTPGACVQYRSASCLHTWGKLVIRIQVGINCIWLTCNHRRQ